jgi:hypothetical protein
METRPDPNYVVSGKITNMQGKAIEGLLVRAYDRDARNMENPLGKEAVTDPSGYYAISFAEKDFKKSENEKGGPDVFIRVFDKDQLFGQSPVMRNTGSRITIDFHADCGSTNTDGLDFEVHGIVSDEQGGLVAGISVQAFDQDLRSRQALGKSTTDTKGFYRIRYSSRQFRKAEKGNADLVVQAVSADGSVLASSQVVFNAPAIVEVNITVPADARAPLSLFEKISQAVEPLLDGTKLEELEEDKVHQDLSFLSGETGYEKTTLARFAIAHKIKEIQPEFWFVLLGSSFYIFDDSQSIADQLASIQNRLPSLDANAVGKALVRGFNSNEIPQALKEKTVEWIDAFLKLVANRVVSDPKAPTFIKSALVDAGITDAKKQEAFSRLFNQYMAFTPELSDALAKDKSFNKEQIADLSASYRLSELTQSDFSIVGVIKKKFGVRQPQQIRSLAKKSEDDWVSLVRTSHEAGDITIPIESSPIPGRQEIPVAEMYGKMLGQRFREAFPTTAFAGGLERAMKNGGTHGLNHAETFGKFLALHEDFELLNTPVDDFMNNRVSKDFRTQAADQAFRTEVKATQRVFKLAPTFEATDALLADGLHSAQKIYRMGESEFVRTYAGRAGFTTETAALAWNRAADTHAAVLSIVADLKGLESDGLPTALKIKNMALSDFPNWNNLFKTGDQCECEECRSVLSPAAYFADLLVFLKDRKAANPAQSVKDILFKRRSDLGYIELNCENALTPFPYIDTVCEVLEDVVADGGNDIELPGFTIMPSDPAAAKTAVAAALASHNINYGSDFSLTQVDPLDPNRWVAHGDEATYLLRKKGTPNFFTQVLRNTKTSADELRAYPQYVNPKAYDKLKAAKYPLGLPFDLFAEEVRASFGKSNLKRWDLMQTLKGVSAPNNPTDGDMAAEYFGISSDASATFDEKRLILVADTTTAGQQTVWGETGADWLQAVGNVYNFFLKTGLEYNDLLTLLDLKFINPTGDIGIVDLDDSCDTDQKVIQILDAVKLDRIHRFLRMWRKLKNWKMWELDLVIRHPQIGKGALDEPFIESLFYFCRLKERLGAKVTVEQICGLFGDINTNTAFTEPFKKRSDALFQQLFLNKRLINPIDPAFKLDPVSGDLPGGQSITSHRPVIIATLGIREADLILFEGLTKPLNGLSYITDDLTLSNLSFLWRHTWLAKLLKFKPDEWKLFLEINQENIQFFTSPETAFRFVEKTDYFKATGFTPDELSWLLAADRTAKAAIQETDAARFLTTLRKDIQGIIAEYDPGQYDFLTAIPPIDVDRLTGLLSSLLQKLNRDETGIGLFFKTLQGGVTLAANVQSLPLGYSFPAAITSAPNYIPIRFDEPAGVLRFTGILTDAQRTILLGNASLATVTILPAYVSAIQDLYQQSITASNSFVFVDVNINLPGGVTLPSDRPSLPIRYDSTTKRLGFTGLMADAERLALIAAGNPASAINELFQLPRMLVKFYSLDFSAPLETLPPSIDFKAQLSADLSLKISYDPEQKSLSFTGIMSSAEKSELDGLVPNVLTIDIAYHNAIASLATQPGAIVPPDDRIWLADTDLDPTLPANDTLAKRLANAAAKALVYLSKTLTTGDVVQECAAQTGLTEALTRRLLDGFSVMPPISPDPAKTTLLEYFTKSFAPTTGVADYTVIKPVFDGWFWLNRVAAIIKKWKITLADLESIVSLSAGAKLIDLEALPMDDAGVIAPFDLFLRTSRLMRLRDSLPETNISFFGILTKLNNPPYTDTDFAADVELVNEAWLADDVKKLVSLLDINFPSNYLLAETWERLRRAFYFLDNLNANAERAASFAKAAMGETDSKTIKELLRSRFGEETFLELSAEIQDVLRERKRDALASYILTLPQPADAPTGKWENTNDLYAYYLLDVEMSSCMLTSRLVQGSGSIQLFVQRCFMGLEPDVKVIADGDKGDSAWRWWKWMSKYRVWEANRKVFLWPENWIEPELKKDRSSFFKDLENELLQNDITQDTVETAFENYLQKLDGVAQLEIAGFYQQDDGDNAIVHVFGRTVGAEPHIYYYRTYDYRQWSPWEKVDLDIKGDYLVPAVVNNRLFLFWPMFTETSDSDGNNTFSIPSGSSSPFTPGRSKKKLRLQMAVSDYRQGKWTPKRVSQDYDESSAYDEDIVKKSYRFFPIDRSDVDGRFGIKYDGYSVDYNGKTVYGSGLSGSFEIAGCNGAPVLTDIPGNFGQAIQPTTDSIGHDTAFMKWAELGPNPPRADSPANDFTLDSPFSWTGALRLVKILEQTPWFFKMTPAWHLSYLDKFWLGIPEYLMYNLMAERKNTPMGSWLPFFYNDKKRTFFVLPSIAQPGYNKKSELYTAGGSVRNYYPDIKKDFRKAEELFTGLIQTALDGWDLSTITSAERQQLDEFLWLAFPELASPPWPQGSSAPPYSEEEIKKVKSLVLRWYMSFVRYFLGIWSLFLFQFRQFHFKNYYHPFVCNFAKLVYNPLAGIPALMSRDTQLTNSGFRFFAEYQPTPFVVEPTYDPADPNSEYYPEEIVDFSPDGAYASYNWELFYHAPLFIANSLSKNQRFEEARDWYHFIFNPIGVESSVAGGSAMSKYWITKPFFETTDPQYVQQRIDNILKMLAGDTSVPGYSSQAKKALEDQVLDWRTNPFEPHRIANYRTVAYQKTVVMKYLDNLIAWGDYLFRQDSMESTNEATQLYILAAEILGPRPKNIPPRVKPPQESYNELEKEFDKFSNALVEVENLVPLLPGNGSTGSNQAPLPTLYFCIPQNDKLLGYWDTVTDRLYKLRNCMNIEGVIRQLSLFEPPIDPGALVKAVSGGLDISSALSDLSAPLPLYRFDVLLQKANEVCNDVRALGSALLSALEKKDAEALGLLRQNEEIKLLEAVKEVREKQIDEANDNLAGILKNQELVTIKKQYYESRSFMNVWEATAITLNTLSTLLDIPVSIGYILGGVLKAIPDFTIGAAGFGGTPHATAKTGGMPFGDAAKFAAEGMAHIAKNLDKMASLSSTMASYNRRKDDWDFQKDLAVKELEQLDQSYAAAQKRIDIAVNERDNQILQIENAKEMDAFMRSKYTNQELYQWQVGQISAVYFQSYKMAYDLAKRAERCYRFELGVQDSSYINFGYWDSLKKGLLSGEKLQYDLRRLEAAYLEQNRREFELTKHISLVLLDPLSLVKLRETGRCFISLPEELFDLDFPGHYFRRIKSVSITLPCVVGPYTTISCTLRLLKNSIRINTLNGDNGYVRNTDDQGLPADDSRFIENNIPVKAIAASNAQNDAGMFELMFRDDRYLPFEGAGAVSNWALELFNDIPSNNPDPANPDFGKPLRQFDYSTISDAILHVKYTSREDAGAFKNGAIAHLRDYLSAAGTMPLMRLFNLRQEFPAPWARFLNPLNPADGNVFEMELSSDIFLTMDQDKTLQINSIWLLARCTDAGSYKVVMTPPLPVPPPAGANAMTLAPINQYGGLHFANKDTSSSTIEIAPTDPPVTWLLKMTRPGGGNLKEDPIKKIMEVTDMFLVLGYEWI